MRRIKLTKGYVALVDNEDYERVMAAGPWHAFVDQRQGKTVNVYAVHSERENGQSVTYRMHRFIMRVYSPLVDIDHKDHSGLNNQKYNLRRATGAQNCRNVRLYSSNTSGYKGVSAHKTVTKPVQWKAQIRFNLKHIYLGLFPTAKQAALAYDTKARELFGEFAHTNF